MRNSIIGAGRGSAAFVLLALNTVFWALLLYPLALLKLIAPAPGWRKLCDRGLNWIATGWISVNNLNLALTGGVKWRVSGLEGLDSNQWYLVLSNHQSWSDILVLQKVFNRRIPFLKFFIKQELIWVPILGLAWWALDYPFMKRYSKAQLEKRPELKGKDLETTKQACEKFKTQPISIMNFVEGTRFTRAKHQQQQSPHQHLLRPKAAGAAFVLSAMGGRLSRIVDVTIVYPGGAHGLWGFLSGQVKEVVVQVETMPIPPELSGDYFNDLEFQKGFQNWLNGRWNAKDKAIKQILEAPSTSK